MNLFGEEKEVIRTLGFYQPFGSLMLNGKKETRWVRQNKKPPFPLGKYLLYTTKSPCTNLQLYEWCGPEIMLNIRQTLLKEITDGLNGYALAIGELLGIEEMLISDQPITFVKYQGVKSFPDKDGKIVTKIQYCLNIKNIQRIVPFEFKFGKQGVGILPESEKEKIILAD